MAMEILIVKGESWNLNGVCGGELRDVQIGLSAFLICQEFAGPWNKFWLFHFSIVEGEERNGRFTHTLHNHVGHGNA
jgi:hypothetical protein